MARKQSIEDEAIVIKRDKVYTSYFSRASKIVPDRRLVSIARTSPEGWNCGFIRELNPSQSLLYNYKQGKVTDKEYEETYQLETLNALDPQEIYNQVKGKVLCCWEKSDCFCHRHLILKWLQKNFGENIIGGEI